MERTAEPTILLGSLATNLKRIEAAARRLSPEQLMTSPTLDTWSPNQVLWHIRATADVYDEHIRRILDEDTPTWRHVSPRARMKKSRYDQLAFADSFAAFQQQRTKLIELLQSLPPEAWKRIALVRVDKKERRLSLHERVRGMADHEDGHCHQMEQVAEALRARHG